MTYMHCERAPDCVYTATEPHCELCGRPMDVTELERRSMWGVCDRCYEARR